MAELIPTGASYCAAHFAAQTLSFWGAVFAHVFIILSSSSPQKFSSRSARIDPQTGAKPDSVQAVFQFTVPAVFGHFHSLRPVGWSPDQLWVSSSFFPWRFGARISPRWVLNHREILSESASRVLVFCCLCEAASTVDLSPHLVSHTPNLSLGMEYARPRCWFVCYSKWIGW